MPQPRVTSPLPHPNSPSVSALKRTPVSSRRLSIYLFDWPTRMSSVRTVPKFRLAPLTLSKDTIPGTSSTSPSFTWSTSVEYAELLGLPLWGLLISRNSELEPVGHFFGVEVNDNFMAAPGPLKHFA